MIKIITSFLLIALFLFAEDNNSKEVNSSEAVESVIKVDNSELLENLNEELADIDKKLAKKALLITYSSHLQYLSIVKRLKELKREIAKIDKIKRKKKTDKEQIAKYLKDTDKLKNARKQLNIYAKSPFDTYLNPEIIKKSPPITNPFSIVNAFSYIKHLKNSKKSFFRKDEELKNIIILMESKQKILKKVYSLQEEAKIATEIELLSSSVKEFTEQELTLINNLKINNKKIDEAILKTNQAIEGQLKSIVDTLEIIIIVIIFSFILKLLAKKYIEDNERVYKVNKTINILNITIIFLILLFSYIDNVKNVTTVIGFVSAGIAFAMKDFFMSIFAWFLIMFGGNYHVGDRVRVKKDGVEYVGDIVDISMLNLTVLEDVTLTTYLYNRRAGRVIFIPNNYIFTTLIANYTHNTLKTVWDGIDITITFDSNHKKATHIAKEITRKYSKGYTEISRKQLNRLRNVYSLKNTNVEPRILTFIEENGIKISCWYMTNAYATLTLRSSISADILDAFKEEKDITIAYPTQTIYYERGEGRESKLYTSENP